MCVFLTVRIWFVDRIISPKQSLLIISKTFLSSLLYNLTKESIFQNAAF